MRFFLLTISVVLSCFMSGALAAGNMASLSITTSINDCPKNLRIGSPATRCLSDFEFMSRPNPTWGKSNLSVVSPYFNYFIYLSKNPQCNGVGITHLPNNPVGGLANAAPPKRDEARGECEKKGCECALAIESGAVMDTSLLASWTRPAAPATPPSRAETSAERQARLAREEQERLGKELETVQREMAVTDQQRRVAEDLAKAQLLEYQRLTNEIAKLRAETNERARVGADTTTVAQARPPRAAFIAAPGPAAGQSTVQITSNALDAGKKTSPNEVWVSFNPSITVQERQFCRIVENFRTEHELAQQSKNQIRVNEAFRTLSRSLNALLPDGKFQAWIMRTIMVAQAPDGSAEVLLELPCSVYVGSNACDADPRNFYGTVSEGSRIYSELAKMTVGDFALTSGQFVFTDPTVFDRSRSVASFRMLKTAAHCRAREMPADSDFFGVQLDVISTIK